MMPSLYIALSIFLGFFAFYLLTVSWIRRLIGRRVCVLCFAASSTWITLLALSLVGLTVDPIILAIFLGGTTVGVTYQVDEFLLIHDVDLPAGLVKLLVFLVGVSGAYLYAAAGNLLGLALMGVVVVFGFLSLTPSPSSPPPPDSHSQNSPGSQASQTDKRKAGLAALIKEKLEDCC
jgi:hypothetical protein